MSTSKQKANSTPPARKTLTSKSPARAMSGGKPARRSGRSSGDWGTRQTSNGKAASRIRFTATLVLPRTTKPVEWTFLTLPRQASAKLPSRSKVSVEGTINGLDFRATLEPDGQGGHWLQVGKKLRDAIAAQAGDIITLDIAPVARDQEPEPTMPADLRKALAAAPKDVRAVWSDITPIARRDWIHWIVSAKQAETRTRRIRNACDMLAKGKRRPCCFDRSGMYDKSLSCPVAAAR